MSKMIFVNLPVADVARSTAFYEAIGFTKDEQFSNEQGASMRWSDEISIMLLSHDFYRSFMPHKAIADTAATSEVILCLSFDSREAVDAVVERAIAAGSKGDVNEPDDHGWMYGRSFEDLDGHSFGPFFMDLEAAKAAMAGDAEAA
ncbi:lactoylglutathione lyase [Sphingomonas sp. IC-56]|uniref:VOC family protein n=1 Tax=Sphingomonas sp. IC-56 TaxID=2898529 RepID=UPI001E401050|nr:VOC family protein [Sphingomonas sp. IC-56]MCD2322818.1 lactoylglutathione lyase [Sphingomonas sp. IC-56]